MVAVAGFLSSLAYPTYQSSIAKARRADALVATLQVQIAQERFRSASLVYGSLSDIGVAATSPSGHYVLAVASSTATGYSVQASASGAQRADTRCRFMTLSADGANVEYRSGPSDAVDNDALENRKCWNF